MLDLDKDTGKALWEKLFKKESDLMDGIVKVLSFYPEKKSVYVDYNLIASFDRSLAAELIENPLEVLKWGEDALEGIVTTYNPDFEGHINLRVRDLPRTIEIRKLRSDHVGRLVAIKGLVKKVKEVRPRLVVATFKCNRCGTLIPRPQEGNYISYPPICPNQDCKAKSSDNFTLDINRSIYIDSQTLTIEESTEGLRGGEQPQRIEVLVEDDITGNVLPGDVVNIVGVLKITDLKPKATNLRVRDTYIYGISMETNQDNKYDATDLSEEDISEILELSRDPNIITNILNSIAPEIYGMEDVKLALALQQFGGVRKVEPHRLRGDIHILMIGDPGIAKSQLIKRMIELAPRGRYTSGKASTGAGLTATAVRETSPDGSSEWTLEAGTLVLSDMGIAGIDEIDKMADTDRDSMYEAMEQQTISVSKAGINATLQARCAILSAANPRSGRIPSMFYDLSSLTNLPPPLISRFDLIFLLRDVVDAERDRELADTVIRSHLAGEMHNNIRYSDRPIVSEMDVEEVRRSVEGVIPRETLRKYISYARTRVFPVLTEDARTELIRYYKDMRMMASQNEDEESPIPFTPRQLEAIIRLSEAYARARLSSEVVADDVINASKILKEAYKSFNINVDTGEGMSEYNAMMTTGKKTELIRTERKAINRVQKIIKEHYAETHEAISKEEILEEYIRMDGNDMEKMSKKELQPIRMAVDGELKRLSTEGLIISRHEGGKIKYKPAVS